MLGAIRHHHEIMFVLSQLIDHINILILNRRSLIVMVYEMTHVKQQVTFLRFIQSKKRKVSAVLL